MLLEELKPAITQLKEKLDELKGGLKIAQKEERIEDLEHQMAAPGFWDDPDKAQVVAQEANNLKSEVETYHGLSQKLEDVETLWEMAMEEKDDSLQGEIEEEVENARKTLADLELGMLLSDQYDANNAILTLHAGAGGPEVKDSSNMGRGTYMR